MKKEATVRIYCGGKSDVCADVGSLVYEPVSGTLYELTSKPGAITTGAPKGNYRRALAVVAKTDVSELSESEFDGLHEAAVE